MIVIGKINEIYHTDDTPSIFDVISKQSYEGKEDLLRHLKNSKVISAAPGFAIDVITGKKIDEPLVMKSDGKYAWRSDVEYYISKYNMSINEDVKNDILSLDAK